MLRNGAATPTPATASSMSSRPYCCWTRSTIAVACVSAVTSTAIGSAALPVSRIRLDRSSRRSARRAAITSVAPSAASAKAVASPMPEEAPVTKAILPLSFPVCMFSLLTFWTRREARAQAFWNNADRKTESTVRGFGPSKLTSAHERALTRPEVLRLDTGAAGLRMKTADRLRLRVACLHATRLHALSRPSAR